jgi:hypothetical protein
MQQPNKRLGELLVESGLIMPAQLQSAITHQKIARGRLGSNLVALGYISEEVLMDFLSHQTGVPQMDVRNIEIAPQVLKLVPQRLADQFTVLPISTKEPKSLVLAMSDPSDLNAIDSARFASGLNIEPVVASHSALRKAISDLYRRLEAPTTSLTVEVGHDSGQEDALPVSFTMAPPLVAPTTPPATHRPPGFPPDPFFDGPAAPTQPVNIDPFGLFETAAVPRPAPQAPKPDPMNRTLGEAVRPLESYQTRTLVLGLIRLFQRRSIIGQDELQRLLTNLVESGEIKDSDRIG